MKCLQVFDYDSSKMIRLYLRVYSLAYLAESTNEERIAMTQMAQNKIDQKTRAATERVALGLDQFTKKMLSENQYMTHEVSR